MVLLLILIVVAGLLIQGCSTINLSANLFFNSGNFKQFNFSRGVEDGIAIAKPDEYESDLTEALFNYYKKKAK